MQNKNIKCKKQKIQIKKAEAEHMLWETQFSKSLKKMQQWEFVERLAIDKSCIEDAFDAKYHLGQWEELNKIINSTDDDNKPIKWGEDCATHNLKGLFYCAIGELHHIFDKEDMFEDFKTQHTQSNSKHNDRDKNSPYNEWYAVLKVKCNFNFCFLFFLGFLFFCYFGKIAIAETIFFFILWFFLGTDGLTTN